MNIRAYLPGDAPRMEEIFKLAVREIGSAYYSEDQIAAWGGPRVDAARLDALYSDGRATFIAEDETGRAIAFSDLEDDGHVDMLYCDPAYARRGIATGLLAAAEREAHTRGLKRLYTEASEAARSVFERAGFAAMHRRDLEIDGVSIHNWAMEKRLA